MATTATSTRNRPSVRGRASGRARGGAERHVRGPAEGKRLDLLAAVLVGAAVGAGALALMQPEGRRGAAELLDDARDQAKRWGRRGMKALDRHTPDFDARDLRRYAERARHAIDEAVHDELDDLRRAVRRRRKQLGI